MTDLPSIRKRLEGFTDVRELAFKTELGTYECQMRLRLSHNLRYRDSEEVTITFEDVSNVRISNIGSGISQFLSLEIENIVSQGLERKHFRITERENDAISFYCAGIFVEPPSLERSGP